MAEPFDVNTDPLQGVTLTPDPGVVPSAPLPIDSGLPPNIGPVMGPPPAPPVPMAVPPPPPLHVDPKNQLAALAALGMAVGMGPRGGGAGPLAGFIQQQAGAERQRQEQYAYAQQLAQRQNAIDQANYRIQTTQYDQRGKQLQSAILAIQKQVAQAKTFDEYAALVTGFGAMLRNAGYRVSDQQIREMAKFVPPDEKETLGSALDKFYKDPSNKALIANPDVLNKSNFTYVDAEGRKRSIPFREALLQSGRAYASDGEGNMLEMPQGSTLEDKASADAIFQTLLAQAKKDGFDVTDPKTRLKLQQQALDIHKRSQETAEQESAISLSPAGLDAAALVYARTGQTPPMGLSKQSAGVRTKIINRAAELYPGLDVTGNKAQFAADEGSLKNLQKQRDSVLAFERTAGQNLDRFISTAEGIKDTGSPILNRPYRQIRRVVLGDPAMASFDAARLAAQNEVARVLNSANLSGQLTDNARREMEAALSPDATVKQLVAAAKLLKADMATRKQSYDTQIQEIQQRIRQKPGETPKTSGESDPNLESAKKKLGLIGG